MRGEQRQAPTNMPMCRGSPPLARGTGTCPPCRCWAHRITPACAGNSSMPSISGVIMWDHPRLRGEQVAARQISCIFQGSPPLARGTGAGSVYVRNLPGITPACAGNRHSAISSSKALKDHPRLRGEQLPQHGLCRHVNGSPPLARGTAVPSYFRQARAGITPACAGNSAISNLRSYAGRDHPRLRGEQAAAPYSVAWMPGSPPLARGTDN